MIFLLSSDSSLRLRARAPGVFSILFATSIAIGCGPGTVESSGTTTTCATTTGATTTSDTTTTGTTTNSGTIQCFNVSADCNGDPADGCETDLYCNPDNCGGCGISCGGSACYFQACVDVGLGTALADIAPTSSPVVIDSTYAYWVSNVPFDGPGTVSRVPLDGSGPPEALAAGEGYQPAIVRSGDSIYWGAADAILKLAISGPDAGSSPIEVASAPGTGVRALAVNATTLFWSDGDHLIWSVPLAGGVPTSIMAPESDTGILDLVADDEAVYWLTACYSPCDDPECPDPMEGGQIARADAAGNVTVLVEGECDIAHALLSDGASVYWGYGAHVMKVPVTGGVPTMLMDHTPICGGGVTDLAVDGGVLYGLTMTGVRCGEVFSVPVAGGAPVTLVASQQNPRHLAVDASHVYWINEGVQNDMTKEIFGASLRKTPKSP